MNFVLVVVLLSIKNVVVNSSLRNVRSGVLVETLGPDSSTTKIAAGDYGTN